MRKRFLKLARRDNKYAALILQPAFFVCFAGRRQTPKAAEGTHTQWFPQRSLAIRVYSHC